MFTIDFNTPIHVHFIGIGGISMSGLAKILLDRHFTVSGSDAHISDLTTELQQDGCIISYPQSADNITGDIDLVVYTAAIHPDNPELKAAVDAGIPTLTRAELLGQIMKNYHTAVNVAGTHGKTTTTSMITEILLAADADPTISVGGILNSIGGNIRVGRSDLFVTEACEYTNSFLSFNPTINIILNVKADKGKIQQVIYNLVDNAIKFSHDNSFIYVTVKEKGDKAQISIKDTGSGIAKKDIDKIWDRFYKSDASRGRDKKGSGLGLSITKEIIQAHEEHIDVISTADVGTEFIFTLPLAKG
jgi:UDP-N-acetylmuramate-alanine ligase